MTGADLKTPAEGSDARPDDEPIEPANEPVQPASEPGGARRFGAGWRTLGIIVALLLAFGAGLFVPVLTRPGDDSPEAGFARDMSTHHAQAVEMGVMAYAKATDPEVRSLGIDIALTQKAQIGMMQTWLRDWHLDPTGSQPRMAWMPGGAEMVKDGLMPGMATKAQLDELRSATGHDFDILFLRLMRAHHVGGIHMAKGVLKLSDESQVRELAEAMVTGQQSEIQVIDAALARLGAS